MAQKLTLSGYLEGRGSRALTRIEAEVFGIPFPLQCGWPAKYSAIEITAEMLEQLAVRISAAKQSTAERARRGLKGAGMADSALTKHHLGTTVPLVSIAAPKRPSTIAAKFPGFVIRKPRRLRRPAPCM